MSYIPLADGRRLDTAKPLVMGIINCTPDSFAVRSDTPDKAIELARRMIDEGAEILDIGGESSRPGSEPVSAYVEMKRVLPVIEAIRKFSDIPLSIDTYKAVVAENALTAGVNIINDISALALDDDLAEVTVHFKSPVVLMHMKGSPRTMQDKPFYDDVIQEVYDFLEKRIEHALAKGIEKENIIIDPGIGFGKRSEDNLMIIKHLKKFKGLGRPILVGASRKKFIGLLTGEMDDRRVDGSLAAAAISVFNGADIIRVHDVGRTVRAVTVASAVREV